MFLPTHTRTQCGAHAHRRGVATHTAPRISISTPSRSHYENPQGGGNPFTSAVSVSKFASYSFKFRDDNRTANALFLKVYTAPSSESAESM